MLTPEDWLKGGYEPSVTFWGPLEAEHIGEQLLELMPLALTPMCEDGAATGTTKVATTTMVDDFEIDDPAPMAGTVPASVPSGIWARAGTPAQAQPLAQIPRVSGLATFVWIGDDPSAKTPHVTLQFEQSANNWVAVSRRSGRTVDDSEIVLAYTPNPLQRSGPQTHYWVAEWQAVPWVGAPSVDALADRGGVPVGRYRFHVEGKGWMLDSSPFDVVPGGVSLQASRVGGNIRTTVRLLAAKGYRLMDMSVMSNQPVPVRSEQVTFELLGGTTVLATSTATTDASGVVSVPDNASATSVRVTDRFGNVGTVTL